MLYFDNVLQEDTLKEVEQHIEANGFKEYDFGDKSFWACLPTSTLTELITEKVSVATQKPLDHIFSFIREATDKQDTDWRIHADSIIFGQQPLYAAVLYISDKPEDVLNGTAFWTHKEYGKGLVNPENKVYDDLLSKDANDKSKWELDEIVSFKKNRLLIYPATRFHSAYPNKAWGDGRIVMASFFKSK